MHNKKFKKGFTLIELLVLVSIITFISTAGIVMLTNARKEARDTTRKANLDSVADALEIYYDKFGIYPVPSVSDGECDSSIGKINCLSPSVQGEWN